MKKNLLWMLAAILACGSMFTSCTNGVDNPVTPIADPGPDEAGMFIQNVLSDGRYTKDYMGVQGDGIDYLRLDVGSYEEALVEFMKLLPEGVAATAYEETVKGADSAVGFVLNAPMNNDLDSIVIAKIKEPLVPMTGYAWVYLTPDIQKALNVKMIIYMPSAEDDMTNFIKSITDVLPYSKIDPNDKGPLICTVPTRELGAKLQMAFITTKMMIASTTNEKEDVVFPLTDSQGNSYGILTAVNLKNLPEGANGMHLFDDALKAKMAETIGMGFSKLSFVLATPTE